MYYSNFLGIQVAVQHLVRRHTDLSQTLKIIIIAMFQELKAKEIEVVEGEREDTPAEDLTKELQINQQAQSTPQLRDLQLQTI
jgi:hypothetical protein